MLAFNPLSAQGDQPPRRTDRLLPSRCQRRPCRTGSAPGRARSRVLLLVRARTRAILQPFLREWRTLLEARGDRRVRWAIDVDPQEV